MKKLTLKTMQFFALTKSGKVLSKEYVSSSEPLLWECSSGHSWHAAWSDIRKGRWCRKCHTEKRKFTLVDLQQHAENRGGKLITLCYNTSLTPVLWECSKGHQWKARWNNIKNRNQWCPTCDGQTKPNIDILNQHAENKEGKLLSTVYINSTSKLSWQCKKEHIWEASWASIKRMKSWCPVCTSFKTENECRNILELYFHSVFPKTRFIFNNTRYEFDGYNEKNNIAFEYNGEQHYKYPNHWHKTEDEYIQARQRDREKLNYCKEKGIKLITIPYTENTRIEQYILGVLLNGN